MHISWTTYQLQLLNRLSKWLSCSISSALTSSYPFCWRLFLSSLSDSWHLILKKQALLASYKHEEQICAGRPSFSLICGHQKQFSFLQIRYAFTGSIISVPEYRPVRSKCEKCCCRCCCRTDCSCPTIHLDIYDKWHCIWRYSFQQ
jgi:hypothetical protein